MAVTIRVKEKGRVVAAEALPPPEKIVWNGDPWQLLAAELLSK